MTDEEMKDEEVAPVEMAEHTETKEENAPSEKSRGSNPWKIVAIVTLLAMAGLAGVLAWIALTPKTVDTQPVATTDKTPDTVDTIPTGAIERQALKIDWIPLLDQVSTTSSNINAFDAYLKNSGKEYADFGLEEVTKLGVVNGGPFDHWMLALHRTEQINMGSSYSYYYVLQSSETTDATKVLLSSYGYGSGGFGHDISYDLNTADTDVVISLSQIQNDDGALIIPELEDYPQTIKDKDGNKFRLDGTGQRTENPVNFLRTHSADDIQTTFGALTPTKLVQNIGDPNSFVFLRKEDGIPVYYDLSVPFWEDETSQSLTVPIRWNENPRDVVYAEYIHKQPGGCGSLSNTNVVDEKDLGNLVVGGSIPMGGQEAISISVPTDYTLDHYTYLFDTWKLMNSARGLDDFIAKHPVFYYRDSLGRLVEFQSTELIPQAECGKPVIYLYPERAMDLTVTLDPKGGFSYTEPVYDNGWRVNAEPNGTLTNLEDGQSYPYLFWEGRGASYSSPSNYWVVKRDDVEHFLIGVLHQLGLNSQETADFMEFWLPRMQSAPWYKIGFHGTRAMDQLAPMHISSSPDTVLRILMDYEELQQEIPSNPPRLPRTPVRDGFTVIEWGGVLRR